MNQEQFTAVYLPRGGVTHLLPLGDSPNEGYAVALCGTQPQWAHYWFGTGSEQEYAEACSRPLCSRCATARGVVS